MDNAMQGGMDDVKLELNEKGDGRFYLRDEEEEVARMEVNVSGKSLTVFHTEVNPGAEGKGLAKRLLGAMVSYARENGLQVIPLCPYVHAQFGRHPEMYADIWNKS